MAIFISYRRSDTEADAGRLYDDLAVEFGTESLFKDVDNVPLGVDVRQVIEAAVANTSVMLLLIGPAWSPDRLADTDDWVRVEIETALRHGVAVVPVRFRRANMPKAADLPDSLRRVATLNAAEVEHQSWRRDLAPLKDSIRSIISHHRNVEAAVETDEVRRIVALARSWYEARIGSAEAPPRLRVAADHGLGLDEMPEIRILLVPALTGPITTRVEFSDLVPSDRHLESLADHLRQHGQLGFTLHLEPPIYQSFAANLVVHVREEADPNRTRSDAEARLFTFYHPTQGGHFGTGSEFGRPVMADDFFHILRRVEDIERVETVELRVTNPITGEVAEPQTLIELHPATLPYLDFVRIEAAGS